MASPPRAGRGMPENFAPLGAGHHLKRQRAASAAFFFRL